MKRFCAKCGKEKESKDTKILCECESQYFICGENYKVDNQEITCNCNNNNDSFKEVENTYTAKRKPWDEGVIKSTYECDCCGNKIVFEKFIGKDVELEKFIKDFNNNK